MLLVNDSRAQEERAWRWAFPNFNGLDFSSGSPVLTNDSLTGAEGTAAICDAQGNLVFYSNGNKVWQANGTIMQGGTGLIGSTGSTQSSIVVPSILSTTRYYLFCIDSDAGADGLQYYDVEMTLNGGQGGVVGPTLLLDTAVEKLSAVKHANDRDYWVLGHRWESDDFTAFLVDLNGVNQTPVVSSVGIEHLNSSGSGEERGQMKTSPDGAWVATCNFSSGYVQLFRFNNATGGVSDPITLHGASAGFFPYGVEFSNDSKKLFVARGDNTPGALKLFQFDLDHINEDCLLASETPIADTGAFPFRIPGDLQLGTNGEIYIGSYDGGTGSNTALDVVHEPTKMGVDSDFDEGGLSVNFGVNLGLSNFVSTFLSDGITYEFSTNCDQDTTWFFPEDTLGVDSVQWVFGDPTSGANTSSTLNAGHVFTTPDTFQVTLYSHTGNDVDTFVRDVIIWDTALNLLGNDTTFCSGQSVTLDASWYNSCYVWADSSTNSTFTTNQAGWHWVDVFHQSCQFRDSVFVTLVSNPPQFNLGNDTSVCADVNFVLDPDLQNAFYTWHDGSHDTTFVVDSTGVYWLSASNACGTTTDTLHVELNAAAQPILQFPEDTTVCDTVGLTLDVTFEDAIYEWSDGSTVPTKFINQAGIYWVRVGNSCDTVSDTINVILDSVIFNILPNVSVLCDQGDTIRLLATEDSLVVDWSVGPNSSVLTVANPGTYFFTHENTCGVFSDTSRVLIWDTGFVFTIGNDTAVCIDNDTIVIGNASERFPFDYAWSTGSTLQNIGVFSGVFAVTATNRCVTLTDQISIGVPEEVRIIEPMSRTLCPGETKNLSLSVFDIQSAEWSTGDTGSIINISNSEIITVRIFDADGCLQTDSISLNDFCPGIVNINNVFTPNGDGINDELCAELQNVKSYTLILFDRWGNEIFRDNGSYPCWDGKINGEQAHEGTYFFILETLDYQDESASHRGSFTLFR